MQNIVPPRLTVFALIAFALFSISVPVNAQSSLCSSACLLSYRGYASGNGTTITVDDTRQGVNPYETQLKASTLANSTFKFQTSVIVDGQVYAQPLYMSGLPTTFVASGNAVFVATENDTLHALDASSLSTKNSQSLLVQSGDIAIPQAELPWDDNSGMSCNNITYQVGITGTPVIDPSPPSKSGDPVVFAVAKFKRSDLTYYQYIHAWDFIKGTDTWFDVGSALGWTTGLIGAIGGPNQSALMQNQRAGLALAHDSSGNAIIYIAWGSHCDSSAIPGSHQGAYPYYGWVAAVKYTYSTTSDTGTFSLLASAQDEDSTSTEGGIWMAGAAPAIDDATGDVYVLTGNGDFSTTTNPQHFGQTFARLNGTTLAVNGSYTPNKWSTLNTGVGTVTLPPPASITVGIPGDQDLGSSGPVLMHPVGQTINSKGYEVIGAGKEGVAYVLDPTQMGTGLQAADTADPCTTTGSSHPVQCFQPITLKLNSSGTTVIDGSGSRVPPAFWGGSGTSQNFLYTAGSQDCELRVWQMDPNMKNGTFNTSVSTTALPPLHGTGNPCPAPNQNHSFPYPGGATLVTWNSAGSTSDAILWVADSSGYSNGKAAVLLAYPAKMTVGSQNNGTIIPADSSNGPIANKFTLPAVVNGQVYIGGQGTSTQCGNAHFGTNCGMLARWSQ